jgi:hypothetical protein
VVLESRFRNRNGKCGTPKTIGALSDRYSRPAAPKAAGRQPRGSTNDAARMAGPGRICFALLDFLFSFCSPVNDCAPCMQSRKGGWSRNFSELSLVFLRMRLAFTTRVRLVFRLHFESWGKHQDRGHY